MAPKKKNSTKTQTESAANVEVNSADEVELKGTREPKPFVSPLLREDPANAGFVLQNIDGKLVGRDGMWTRDHSLALHFLTEKDGEAYAVLHHREKMTIMPGQ